ncbi:hypothetical protein [Niveispirillum cyanobacteriorum]|uniref:hypothetical protein n=1 Tax=Niveispirillum cyanobacteriorum TaxID=1612173 RepID=UPI00131A08F0|nr:hypothetical protein [Niveispirillum cyanobacteriorum]GGE79804.1 hypothetical protein GCM10011317_41260 [Niveispirillum cyanobacteriorum]
MPKFAPSEYPFPESKLLQREELAQKIGNKVAKIFTVACKVVHKIDSTVEFNESAKKRIAETYKRKVGEFKSRNEFPLNDRINQGKIAALFVESFLDVADNHPVFKIPESLTNTDFEASVVNEMAWECLISILKLDLDKTPLDCRRDFVLCIHKYTADSEWVAWACANLCAAYGVPLYIGD